MLLFCSMEEKPSNFIWTWNNPMKRHMETRLYFLIKIWCKTYWQLKILKIMSYVKINVFLTCQFKHLVCLNCHLQSWNKYQTQFGMLCNWIVLFMFQFSGNNIFRKFIDKFLPKYPVLLSIWYFQSQSKYVPLPNAKCFFLPSSTFYCYGRVN